MRCLAVLALLVPLGEVLLAHGGTYRGPGGSTPPADTVAPPPATPTSPGRGAAGGAGGGTGPPRPGAPPKPTGQPANPGATTLTNLPADLTTWRRWWGYNQYVHLDVKGALYASADPIGGDVFFLGRGQLAGVRGQLRPDRDDLHKRVVPALRDALEGERDKDLITGCLVALAKIGDRSNQGGHSATAALLRTYLADPNQEVAETAAVCLGILGAEGAGPLLRDLLLDTEDGRTAVERELGVPWRTRAFAAYGIGLLGRSSRDMALRQDLAASLLSVLGGDALKEPSADLAVACVSALGLMPLPLRETLGPGPRRSLSREAQVRHLLEALDDPDQRTVVRSHVPVALARLVGDGLPSGHPLRSVVTERFVTGLEARRDQEGGRASAEVQAGYVLALGRLVTAGEAPMDRLARRVLADAVRQGRGAQTRRFALVALAEAAARPGAGQEPLAGLEEARALLAEELTEGSSPTRPWAGLALGLLGRRLVEAGLDTDPKLDGLVLQSLERARGPEEVGALAIACGLRGIPEAVPALLEQLEESSTDEARGYVCLALGMIGDARAIEAVRALVRGAEYRPDLLRQGSTALGLLGDKTLLPELVERLRKAQSLSAQASLAQGLGTIGDVRSLGPLLELLGNREVSARARAFAAVALGLACDTRTRPWNTPLAEGIDYRANVPTLTDGGGAGILEIF